MFQSCFTAFVARAREAAFRLRQVGAYLLRHEAETLCLGVDKPVHTSAGPKLGYDVIADEIPTRHARTSRAAPRLSVVRTERVRLSQRGRMGFRKLATRLRMATMNVGSMTIENYIFCGITGKGRGLVDVLNRRSSGVSTHSGARRQNLIWGPCLACHKSIVWSSEYYECSE